MSYERLRHRLVAGRPLVLDSDVGAAFRERGVALDTPGALGQLLRERPREVLAHHRAEIESRVDVLSALTADTTPRALAEVGMQHRAALLTGLAVDLACEAASESQKPVMVAGVLGSDMVSPVAADRLHDELGEHAARIAAAGCELFLARGQGSRLGLMAAVVAAASTERPVWAIVECDQSGELIIGGQLGELTETLAAAGASAILFEVPGVDAGLVQIQRALELPQLEDLAIGVLLAGSPSAVRGFPEGEAHLDRWVDRALDLSASGARVIGGGAGTTEAHTEALARALGALHPSVVEQAGA
jgi:methionine synthase I (cobalamin-dependent)